MQVIWDFIQKELLGISWLNRVIGSILNLCGLDVTTRVDSSVQFFLYDTIKILVRKKKKHIVAALAIVIQQLMRQKKILALAKLVMVLAVSRYWVQVANHVMTSMKM